MKVLNPWTKHYQMAWENRAANPALPLWARVVSLAYARHEANGHANIARGSLAVILGSSHEEGTQFKKRDRGTIRDAIASAVKYGFLAEGSCSECLVVPGHAIEGPMGNPYKACPVHEKKLAQKIIQASTMKAVAVDVVVGNCG